MNRYNEDREKRAAEGTTSPGQATTSRADRGDLNRYIDYDVVDSGNNKIGVLECLWSDHTGDPAFLGVKTGWIFGKTHVVPANEAQVNETTRIIRLPFSADMIKGAPAYDADLTMDEGTENEIYNHYHMSRPTLGERELEESRTEERPRFETGLEHEPSAPRPEGTEAARIQLHEEEIRVGKRQVEVGGVRLRKIVRTETVNQPVELQREEVIIERVPASEATPGTAAEGKSFGEQEVFIPLRREEAVIEKKDRVREEVRARKATEAEMQQVSGTVRKEDVRVEKEGQDVRIKEGTEQDRTK